MLDLEFYAKFSDYSVVEICTIICDDSFCNNILIDKVMLVNCTITFLVTVAKEATSTHFVK